MIPITLENVKLLFDDKTILTPAEKFTQKTLGKFGAYCRKVMANSIKAASSDKQHALPGQPPLSHKGPVNFKKTIFYVLERTKKNVIIGAVLLSGTAAAKSGSEPLPGLLERGGKRGAASRRAQRGGRRIPGTVAAHPYALPAYEIAVKKKLPELIAGGIMREV